MKTRTALLVRIRNNFLTGIIVFFPLIVTILFVRFLWNGLNSLVLEPVARYLTVLFPQVYSTFVFKILIFLAVVLLVALIGLATKNILGRRLFSFFERIIFRLPLVNKIYTGIKEISDALLISKRGSFRKVVLVEFPKEGSYTLGFITSEVKGEIQKKTDEEVVNVFVPTTPNPTSGFLLFVPVNKLIFLDMPVEDGIKLVISFGIITR